MLSYSYMPQIVIRVIVISFNNKQKEDVNFQLKIFQ